MISSAAYILISTVIHLGDVTQSTAVFADKPSCENAAQREDAVMKSFQLVGTRWNYTCIPFYHAGGVK